MKLRVAYDSEAAAFQSVAPDGTVTTVAIEGGVDDAAVLAVIRDGIDASRDTLDKLNEALIAQIGAPTLQSPDGTDWILSIGNDGALITTPV